MKYPKMPHLPWSPGGTSDDKRLKDVSGLLKSSVVITEKVDGSNVCLEAEHLFARSHSSQPEHASFDALKAIHSEIRHLIPDKLQIFGEWMYARHSIDYTALPSYLLLFGIRDLNTMTWAPWGEVDAWATKLCVGTVAVAGSGIFNSVDELKDETEKLAIGPSIYGAPEKEGIVIRVEVGFADCDFKTKVAKWVRKDHVQTDEHWMKQKIVRNRLV